MTIRGLEAGRRTYWDPDLKVKCWGDEGVTVGAFCSIAAGVTLFGGGGHHTSTVSTWPMDQHFGRTSDMESRTYRHTKPTVIGNDVWIGTGAMVMPGITVGDGAVIHPGSVVFDDVEPYAIVRGNPAVFRHHRFTEEWVTALLRIKWWDWTDEAIAAAREDFYGDLRAFVEKYDR